MSRRRDLHSKGRKVKGPWGHWHIVWLLDWLGKAAGMLSRWRVGVHGNVVLIQLFTRDTSRCQHAFDFILAMEAFQGTRSIARKGPWNIIAILRTSIFPQLVQIHGGNGITPGGRHACWRRDTVTAVSVRGRAWDSTRFHRRPVMSWMWLWWPRWGDIRNGVQL